VKNSAEKILTRARIMQDGLSTQIQEVIDEVLKLKDDAARG
jgi:hypothetical protein